MPKISELPEWYVLISDRAGWCIIICVLPWIYVLLTFVNGAMMLSSSDETLTICTYSDGQTLSF